MMTAHTDEELERPEAWDDEGLQRHEGRKSRRAVVSIAFAREDFETVVQAARRIGETTSEFIRRAALNRAQPPGGQVVTVSMSGGGTGRSTFYSSQPATFTAPPGRPLHQSVLVDGREVVPST